jgi:hypothetical protein
MLATTSEPTVVLIFLGCVGAIGFRVVMWTRWEQRNNPRQYDRVNDGDWAPTSDPGPMITEQPTPGGQPGGADSLSFADLRAHPAGSADSGPVPPPPPDIPYDESWTSGPEPVIRTHPRGIPTYWKWAIASIAFSAVMFAFPMFGMQTHFGARLGRYYFPFTAILVTAMITMNRMFGTRWDGNPWSRRRGYWRAR